MRGGAAPCRAPDLGGAGKEAGSHGKNGDPPAGRGGVLPPVRGKDDVQDDAVVMRVVPVTVGAPGAGADVNLHVSRVSPAVEGENGPAEIRSSVGVRNAGGDDVEPRATEGDEGYGAEKLAQPGVLEEFLGMGG